MPSSSTWGREATFRRKHPPFGGFHAKTRTIPDTSPNVTYALNWGNVARNRGKSRGGGDVVSKPYDSTTKELVEAHPADWLALGGLAVGLPIGLINSDLSTLTSQADKVILVDGPAPWLVNMELQSGRDTSLPLRVLRYHILLRYRHGIAVESLIVLLRPEADGPELGGLLRLPGPDGGPQIEFRFKVLRVWEIPAGRLLAGGLGTLPLAPIGKVEPERLPSLIREIGRRLDAEATPAQKELLLSATWILMGLKFDPDFTTDLMSRIINMKESATYQAAVQEGVALGREEGGLVEIQRILFRLGTKRLGEPSPGIRERIARLKDLAVLEDLVERQLTAASWDELMEGL